MRSLTRFLLTAFTIAVLSVGVQPQVVKAGIIIDNSPDTTGAAAIFDAVNSFGFQIVGDRFTLNEDVILTGGSIFSGAANGAINDAARFLIFSDPTAAAIIDIATTLDAVDTQFTTSQTSVTRKHASITPTYLAAGDYWFSMPGDTGVNIGQGTGVYDDDLLRFDSTTLSREEVSLGDAFFQLEGEIVGGNVPEPTSLAIFAIGALGVMTTRRRKRS